MATDKNKARALAALLDADSFTSAAAAAGISRKTLYNYLHGDTEFISAYKKQRERQAIERAEQLSGSRQKALDTISAIMDDSTQPGAVRLKAAVQLLKEIDEAQAQVTRITDANDFAAVNSPFSFLPVF